MRARSTTSRPRPRRNTYSLGSTFPVSWTMCTGPLSSNGSTGVETRAEPASDFGGHARAAACSSLQSAPGSLKNGTFGPQDQWQDHPRIRDVALAGRWVTVTRRGGWSNWSVAPGAPAIMRSRGPNESRSQPFAVRVTPELVCAPS